MNIYGYETTARHYVAQKEVAEHPHSFGCDLCRCVVAGRLVDKCAAV